MKPGRITQILGTLWLFVGLSMALPMGVCFLYDEKEGIIAFLYSMLITMLSGLLLKVIGRGKIGTIMRREALFVVAASWLSTGLFGALPYLFGGVFSNPVDAVFESISGFTTTGATVLIDIEGSLSHGINFWRCFTHWLGGMGIVVLFVAILPQLGVGGKTLFKTEVPGPTSEGLRPKIQETTAVLYRIYMMLTLFCMVAYWIAGMPWFDAACHALSTLGTGGFSTRNASLAAYGAPVHFVAIIFMLLAGVNFGLYFLGAKGYWRRALKDRELWAYLSILAVFTCVITLTILGLHGDILSAFQYALFQVVAVITTTGFITDDFDHYPLFGRGLFFLMFFIGGMAGSTAGGLKVMRIMVLFKGGVRELSRAFRPQLVSAVKIGRRSLGAETVQGVFTYVAIYLLIFASGSVVMTLFTGDLVTASSATIASLGNVGPALGDLGAVESYGDLSSGAKLFLSLLMVVGRLEIFALLVLFVPAFWRR